MNRRWGVVGTGRVAQQFVRAIDAADGHELVGVVGRTDDRAREFLAAIDADARGFDSVAAMIASADPDLLYVASPNHLHGKHLMEGLAAEAPVLCEKPLTSSLPAALAIRDRARRYPAPLGVAFQYRQHPAHRRAREVIASGELGDVRMVVATACLPALDVPSWYDDRASAGGGILPMSGVHRVDLVRFLLDCELVDVRARVTHHREHQFDDAAAIVARIGGHGVPAFQFGLDAPHGDDRIAVHGSRASLILESTMSQWWSADPGTLTVRGPDGLQRIVYDAVDTYVLQVTGFARFADGEGDGFATVDDGVAAARFTEAVYESAGAASET